MIEIDGSYGEGGGQVLRSSLTLSALTGKPVRIYNIRANRSTPGLRAQHLAAVQAIAQLTGAKITGVSIGSSELTLIPGAIRSGNYRFTIPTAGALTLVLQTVFLPLSFASGSSEVIFTGGTHVPWSPVFHYLEQQWLPIMQSLGFRSEVSLQQAGFYPKGGGLVKAKIHPGEPIKPFQCLQRGKLLRIRGISGVANLEEGIAKRQKHRALQRLYSLTRDVKIKTQRFSSPGMGSFILLKADFEGASTACFSALGAKGKRAELVADEAVDSLFAFLETDGCVDSFLGDQLLLPLLFTNGDSVFRPCGITPHLVTNIYAIEHFYSGGVIIEDASGGDNKIFVKGGFNRNYVA